MMILHVVLLISTAIYCIGLLFFLTGLLRPEPDRYEGKPRVSVVVAARNAAQTIGNLLTDLTEQTYPYDKMEIIITDDHSSDDTAKTIRPFMDRDSRIQMVTVTSETPVLSAKKNAMHCGIRASRGEIILTTDADCRVKSTWVESMGSYFGPGIGMVIGFSQIMGKTDPLSLFEKIQGLDFLSLMTSAMGSANWGRAQAASGQNLAYRREVFDAVGGFASIGHRISGDDVLLLQLVRKNTKWKVCFASDMAAFNRSRPESGVRAYMNQRTRWASNGVYQFKLNKLFFMYILNTYITNLLLLLSIPFGTFSGVFPAIPLFCFGVKALCEWLLLSKGSMLFNRPDLLIAFPLWILFQVPYVVFVGLIGTVGRFTWKGRNHAVLGGPES